MNLLFSALTKFMIGLILVAALLFLPTETLCFWNAWLFLLLLFLPILLVGIMLYLKNPDLLKKRLNAKEKIKTQDFVAKASALMFLVGFLTAGFDKKYNWSDVPLWLVALSSVIMLFSYALYANVLNENAFLSRTIEVQEKQTVVTTGPYAVVRHPMYTATIFLFLSIPLVLGSYYSLICFHPYLPLIVIRIQSEERFLEKNLSGYREYKEKVKYRLLPYIW